MSYNPLDRYSLNSKRNRFHCCVQSPNSKQVADLLQLPSPQSQSAYLPQYSPSQRLYPQLNYTDLNLSSRPKHYLQPHKSVPSNSVSVYSSRSYPRPQEY